MKVQAIYHPDQSTRCKRPLFMVPVSAGFPSPAEDYIEGKLDLKEYLVKHPAATFFVKVTGNSMIRVTKDKVFLISENKDYKPLQVEEEMGFEVWGVVTNVIHPL